MNAQLEQYRAALATYPDFADGGEAVCIVCQAADAPILVKLASDFAVRAHFTGATCFERAVNLMHHVHQELSCPGGQAKPAENNTYGIMAARGQATLFCWHKATVLTEMLLSVGVPCVRLTCLPQTFDYDRHVVTLAYMPEFDRWVLLDPTFDTYFLDADGLPMDPCAIRRAYLAGGVPRFQHIAIDKHWTLVLNSVVYETYDEWYAVYMAKNMFRLMCPAESRYNDARLPAATCLFINPAGYDQQNEYDETGTNKAYYHTCKIEWTKSTH